MSVKRETAEAFRRHGPAGARKVAEYLRDHHNATRGTIWYEAAEALEQLAKPPRPGLVARLKAKVADRDFAIRDLEAAIDLSREQIAGLAAEVQNLSAEVQRRGVRVRELEAAAGLLALEAVAARALDLAHDTWSSESWADIGPEGALVEALHEAGLFDAEDGTIKPAGEELQLRVARQGSAQDHAPAAAAPLARRLAEPYRLHRPDTSPAEAAEAEACDLLAASVAPQPATRPLRVYVAGGSSEVELVARYVAALRAAGVEITYDWTADVLVCSPITAAEQRAECARADIDGIARADLVWWILPAAKSEWAGFEAGVAHGIALARPLTGHRLIVSGDRAAHGRVFPELAAERWDSHEAAIAAIVSLAAAHRDGDQIPTS